MRKGEPEGLSAHAYSRIWELKKLAESMATGGKNADPQKQSANINSLLHACRNGLLDWHEGLVTYWSNGQPLCRPRPFDYDECLAIAAANTPKGKELEPESFWVEGVSTST